ncbi:hypothetical protein [uncultured Nostoc sp.]|uniref:hypothetical protein n=1 Tax=uncultured Nostoc sp. TaxID=340711 RepID=UPI0035CBFC8E
MNDFSFTVRLWYGEHTVGLQHLKSFNYLPQECQQMQSLSDRISRVYSDLLEETVNMQAMLRRCLWQPLWGNTTHPFTLI